MNSPHVRLHRAIVAAGIPLDGVSGEAGNVRIDFRVEASPEQQAQAQQIANNFDWSPRRPRELTAIEADVLSLNEGDLRKLLARLIADRIQSNTNFAVDLGVAIPGEEVIP